MSKFGEIVFHLRHWLRGNNCPADASPKLILEFPTVDALWQAKSCMVRELEPCDLAGIDKWDSFLNQQEGSFRFMDVEVQFRLAPEAPRYYSRGPMFWDTDRYRK